MPTEHMKTERLLELVQSFDVAMLTTTSLSGNLRARPMAVADVDADGTIWLVTGHESAKTDEIAADAEVGLTMQGKASFVSITATAQVQTDPAKVAEVWSEPMRVWFPDGPESPEIRLIRVRPIRGEYWDVRGTNAASFIWESLKAYAQGERVDDDAETNGHGTVQL